MSLSRVAFRSLAGPARTIARAPVAAAPAVRMSTLIDRKEMAEESRYIRTLEARRQEALKERMQKILSLEDSHQEKQDLINLLDKKEQSEEKGMLASMGLNDWKFALPIGMLVGIPAIANEVLVLDAELQLTACFILFCSTMYTQLGPVVNKALSDSVKEIENELKKADDAALAQVHAAIAENQKALSLTEDYKSVYQLTDEMAKAQAEVLNLAEEHKFRDAIVKKLDSLHALEEAATVSIRQRMVQQVKGEVVKTFTNDKKLKENALNQAIAVLAAGEGAKVGKDIVGESFVSAFNNYRSVYSKQSPESDEILVQLQKDMAAIAEAPVVDAKGGNVFHTL